MEFLTDRKRAVGMGSAKTGTAGHWAMTVSSYGLIVLVPLFIFTFGHILGASFDEVLDYYGRPFPSVVAALTIVVALLHFKNGVRALIEDYVHGYAREFWTITMACVSYALIAAGLLALIKIAL